MKFDPHNHAVPFDQAGYVESALPVPQEQPLKRVEDCQHEQFTAQVDVQRLLDSGKFCADIRVKCIECGSPFRFVGCAAGLRFDRPMVSIDEIELHAPIEPEGEKRLQAGASYQMPEIPQRH